MKCLQLRLESIAFTRHEIVVRGGQSVESPADRLLPGKVLN